MTTVAGSDIAHLLQRLGVTHVVTIPDSTIGKWDDVIIDAGIQIVRVCREGEAWGVAMGLHLGGQRPLVMIQCTGLFESGDALRNVLFEWRLPIPAIVGYRSFLNSDMLPGDTSLVFTEPILDAWGIGYQLVREGAELAGAGDFIAEPAANGRPRALLIAEGGA
ncbi:MAG: thiamine pyrophosphate-binding protein [Gemmatimonadota bacterium]